MTSSATPIQKIASRLTPPSCRRTCTVPFARSGTCTAMSSRRPRTRAHSVAVASMVPWAVPAANGGPRPEPGFYVLGDAAYYVLRDPEAPGLPVTTGR
jgi:hypothetical protein